MQGNVIGFADGAVGSSNVGDFLQSSIEFCTVVVEIFRHRSPLLLGAALAVLAVCPSASAAESADPPPRETVAALDPALVAGRGASLDMVEQV